MGDETKRALLPSPRFTMEAHTARAPRLSNPHGKAQVRQNDRGLGRPQRVGKGRRGNTGHFSGGSGYGRGADHALPQDPIISNWESDVKGYLFHSRWGFGVSQVCDH